MFVRNSETALCTKTQSELALIFEKSVSFKLDINALAMSAIGKCTMLTNMSYYMMYNWASSKI